MSDLTPAAQAHLATHHGVITTRDAAGAQGRADDDGPAGRGAASCPIRARASTSRRRRRPASSSAARSCRPRIRTGSSPGRRRGCSKASGGCRRRRALHLSVRHGVHLPPASGVRLRQTTKLAATDRQERADGIVVASSARLAFDLAADLRPIDHLSVVHQLLQLGLVTTDELVAIGLRLCHPGRRGSTTFEHNIGSPRRRAGRLAPRGRARRAAPRPRRPRRAAGARGGG